MTGRWILTLFLTACAASAQVSPQEKALHALNRLTFGPRPGDIEEVRRMGLEKWIAMQLHPESIPENPELETRLQPLDTLRLDTATLLKNYPATVMRFPRPPMLSELLPPDQMQALMRGNDEEQLALLNKLDEAKRRQVLAAVGPANYFRTAVLRREAQAARQDDQEARQKEMRQMMPPLIDLLKDHEMRLATSGTYEERKEFFASLDPAKLQQVAAAMQPQSLTGFPELKRQALMRRTPQQVISADLKDGKLLRAIYSNRQLEEVLVDFWFNHFNLYESKQYVRPLVTSFERDAIRPHVLGKFKDLLLATAHHPAMLYYLDNYESATPDIFSIGPFEEPVESMARGLARRAHGLNENYGRELMELHTLGVKGGYTQADVIAVARCFTGWTVREPHTNPQFVFAAFMHDSAEKVVLGHKIAAGGGERDGLEVIDILAHHPSTAKFLSRKLAQRFVADDPPAALVDRMAQVFLKTEGDLRAVMAAMFSSPEFFSESARQAKVKSPLEMVVSAVRAAGVEVSDPGILTQRIADLGEPLYGKVEPTGYSNTGEGWLSTANLLGRITFAADLMRNKVAGTRVEMAWGQGKDGAAIARGILGGEPSAAVRSALEAGSEGQDADPRAIAGLVMGSPDFQRR